MTIFVDRLRYWFKGHLMCHVTAKSLTELHDIASHLAMKHEWFQIPPKASFPHYDIPKPQRAMAIEYGTIEVEERTSLYFAARLDDVRG